MKRELERRLLAVWYGGRPPALWMRALVPVYRFMLGCRRMAQRLGLRRAIHPGVPVVVVGNLTAGGAGKTPLVLWLVKALDAEGFRPGVVSRGYGRRGVGTRPVSVDDDAFDVGDEPLLLARRSGCPVQVGVDRVAAARALVERGCDVIVSDDGLQHLRLARDLELLVVDHERGWGNGRLLPAGPLREPVSRAESVDLIIRNGDPDGMELAPSGLFRVADATAGPLLNALPPGDVHAVAGIGHPERFFDALEAQLGRSLIRHAFPDHHVYTPGDLSPLRDKTVIMTEKDAVKCARFAAEQWYFQRVETRLGADLAAELGRRLAQLRELVS